MEVILLWFLPCRVPTLNWRIAAVTGHCLDLQRTQAEKAKLETKKKESGAFASSINDTLLMNSMVLSGKPSRARGGCMFPECFAGSRHKCTAPSAFRGCIAFGLGFLTCQRNLLQSEFEHSVTSLMGLEGWKELFESP